MGGATTFPRLTRRFVPLVLGALIGALLVTNPAGAAERGNLDQCGNGSTGTDTCTANNQWVNGNLNESKAHYSEGDSLPYRLLLSDLTPGSSNTVTIEWDTTKGGKHALDYVTTFNRTVGAANPCFGVSGCGSPTTFPIPVDANVTGAGVAQIPGNFTMYNGTITGASAYTVTGSYAGDSSTRITLTFTAGSATPVLAWAGHISTRTDWGMANSAVGISGSPYHTSLIDLNGKGGNQDRSASASAIFFPASITIVKDAQPNSAQDFSFTATGGLSPAAFTLDDDGTASPVANSHSFTNITTEGTYTFTEAASAGWTLSFPTPCTVTSGNGGTQSANAATRTATVILKEGENVTCTFVNSRQASQLVVVKNVVNDNGGNKTAGDFPILVTGEGASPASFVGAASPGTTVVLDPGPYSVAEGLDTGYTGTYSADCSGSIAAGETKTCTITNDDKPATLTVIKNVVNDDGGDAVPGDFTINVTGTDVSGSSFPGVSGVGTTVTLDAGTYSVAETTATGYAGTFSPDCSGTIALGDSKICTITNDDNAATLTVIKNVVNDDGGDAVPGDFTINVTGTDVSGSSFPGVSGVGTTVTLDAGTYSVAEGPDSGYAGSFSAGCAGTIAVGESKTCTITNNDRPATLTVTKVVVNNDGGTAVVGDFPLFVDRGLVTSGVAKTFDAGTHLVSETNLAGYTGTFGGDCDSDGSVTLSLGETAECTITNNDIANDPDPTDPPIVNPVVEVEVESAADTANNNPTQPLQAAPVPTPALPAPAPVTPVPATSPVVAAELPRTGAGLREETRLALVLMLAGISAMALGRRRNRPAAQ